MKAYVILSAVVALVALAAACDRAASPTEAAPRAVRGTVEVRLGDFVQRYDLRVDRVGEKFASAVRPLGKAHGLAPRLERLPFVRENGADNKPVVIQTPGGEVETRLIYKQLGPWQVLDRAVTSVRLNRAGGGRSVDLEVALRGARLEN